MIMPASPLNWVVVVADGDPVRAGWNRAAQAAGVAAPRFVTWASVLASEAGFRRGEHVFFERLQWQPSHPVGGQAESSVNALDIRNMAEMLEPDGIHAVAWLHRAYLDNDFYDMRFALVDGKVTHAAGVVRERIIAREWYGGRRRELADFQDRFGDARWSKLVALAERTAALFPGIRSLGVDVILDNFEAEYVFDVNPFGAHLPGLVGDPGTIGEGVSVRAAVLRSLSFSDR